MNRLPSSIFGAAIALPLVLFGPIAGRAVAHAQSPAARVLTVAVPSKIVNRQMQPLTDGTRHGLRLDARPGDGLAWWPDAVFGDCTIDVDLRGKDVQQQSFLGVAFHGVDEKTFDDVYFRPFNFKAADAARRGHSVQYESHPGFTWDKLRADHPDAYERAIAAAPDPNSWFHARIVVAYPSVRVFANDSTTPAMDLKQLSDRKTGWVGVWVGNNSDGQFANVTVTPSGR
jgi:hypothetical protein